MSMCKNCKAGELFVDHITGLVYYRCRATNDLIEEITANDDDLGCDLYEPGLRNDNAA